MTRTPDDLPPYAIPTREAARIAGKTRQAIANAHREGAIKAVYVEPGPRGRLFFDIRDVRRVWPKQQKGKHRIWNLNARETDELLGFEPTKFTFRGGQMTSIEPIARPKPIDLTEQNKSE